MNYPRLFLAPRPKVKVAPRGEDLTLEQHAGMLATLLGGDVEKPRMVKRKAEVELKPSCSVVIALTEEKKKLWHKAVLTVRIEDPKYTSGVHECWEVIWLDSASHEGRGVFYPFTGPHGPDEWEFLHDFLAKGPKASKKT